MDMFYKSLMYFPVMLLFTFCLKFAARLMRRVSVSWRHCFLYSLALASVTTCANLTGLTLSTLLPHKLAPTVILCWPIVTCAGYFQRYATRSNGLPAGWLLATALSVLAYVAGAVLFVFLLFGLPMML
ncbi:hypothetical protein [Janthinobacterium psychrotolerans]|uniref:Uncharacterized protein n=1 Tax=Janthinobacterium psychrotolerans TaxID=1747903 RepID=A0A1A7C9N4_9BURK|nr:hypothetical protein [Janthinobacterium psychrotolerans]OBV41023.1 hypothetical protein ASR47_102274 [Janthinobacterium psychrotolerans]